MICFHGQYFSILFLQRVVRQENAFHEGLKFNAAHQLHVYAGYVNLLGENILHTEETYKVS
jgi:hypothetical protein